MKYFPDLPEMGHTALMTGNNQRGYKYLSYGPGENIFSTKDNLEIRTFKNLNTAKDFLSQYEGKGPLNRYDSAMTFNTTKEQEKEAMKGYIKALDKLALRPRDIKDTPPDIMFVFKVNDGDVREPDKGPTVRRAEYRKPIYVTRNGQGNQWQTNRILRPFTILPVRKGGRHES